MKILTKKWLEKCELLRLINDLQEINLPCESYFNFRKKCKNEFCRKVMKEYGVNSLRRASRLYNAQIERNEKLLLLLPKRVLVNIIDIKKVALGYACCQDKKVLTAYSKVLIKQVERAVEKANCLTRLSRERLNLEYDLDDIVGDFVYKEYKKGDDYFIKVGEYEICISNYRVKKKESFCINKWKGSSPLYSWTILQALEIHYNKNMRFELHLFIVNSDKRANKSYHYFTLTGSDIKIIK